MAAEYRIIWSEQAVKDLQEIYDFILLRWSLKEAERLLDQVKEFEEVIGVYPEGFKLSNAVEGVRIGHIHQNTTAVYRIQGKFLPYLIIGKMRDFVINAQPPISLPPNAL